MTAHAERRDAPHGRPSPAGAGASAGRVTARVRARWRRTPWTLRLSGAGVALVLLVAAWPGPLAGAFGHGDPHLCVLADSAAGPRAGHPFGFDAQGCDLYANVVWGTRDSVLIGLLVTLGTLVVAVALGSLAAYRRGWVDVVVSRGIDVMLGFPALVGMVVLLNTVDERGVVVVAGVITVFSWPAMTVLMRASALEHVDATYVRAARGMGAGTWWVLTRHVVPNAVAPVLVVASLAVGANITAESALTFLGVGLQQPAVSWGIQLAQAQTGFRQAPHLLWAPAGFLSFTVLVFVTFGEGVRHHLDPRRTGRHR